MKRLTLIALVAAFLSFNLLGSPLQLTVEPNVLVLGSASVSNASIAGSVFVGGSATFSSVSLANGNGTSTGATPASGKDAVNLIVAGSLVFANGQLTNGSGIYGGSASLIGVGLPDGQITQSNSSVNFPDLAVTATKASASFAAMDANGSTVSKWGGLILTGESDKLNVFTVDAHSLKTANNVAITVPEGAAVLINVIGVTTSFKNAGLTLNGASFDSKQADAWGEVLWNFADATSLTMQGVNFGGTLLAPKTEVELKSGQVNGQVIVGSLVSSAQINNFRFGGTASGYDKVGDPQSDASEVPEPGTFTLAAAGAILLVIGNRTRGARRYIDARFIVLHPKKPRRSMSGVAFWFAGGKNHLTIQFRAFRFVSRGLSMRYAFIISESNPPRPYNGAIRAERPQFRYS